MRKDARPRGGGTSPESHSNDSMSHTHTHKKRKNNIRIKIKVSKPASCAAFLDISSISPTLKNSLLGRPGPEQNCLTSKGWRGESNLKTDNKEKQDKNRGDSERSKGIKAQRELRALGVFSE